MKTKMTEAVPPPKAKTNHVGAELDDVKLTVRGGLLCAFHLLVDLCGLVGRFQALTMLW